MTRGGALVTGASSGIGAAAARRLAADGFTVLLAARRADRLRALERELTESGLRARSIPGALDTAADRERLIAEVLRAEPPVELLVLNAGYGIIGPLERVSPAELRRCFEVNVFSVVELFNAVVPSMRTRGYGRVVLVGSVAGKIARPLSTAYDATKHALEAIADGLRLEVAPFGIDVVLIEPGFVRSEFLEAAYRPAADGETPYGPLEAWRRLAEERSREGAVAPEVIGELIAGVALTPRPAPRYAAPRSARVALLLKRWLPEALFNRLLRLPPTGAGAARTRAG